MFNNETNYYGKGSIIDVISKYKSIFKRLKTEYSFYKYGSTRFVVGLLNIELIFG